MASQVALFLNLAFFFSMSSWYASTPACAEDTTAADMMEYWGVTHHAPKLDILGSSLYWSLARGSSSTRWLWRASGTSTRRRWMLLLRGRILLAGPWIRHSPMLLLEDRARAPPRLKRVTHTEKAGRSARIRSPSPS